MEAQLAFNTLKDGITLRVKHVVTPLLKSRTVTYSIRDGKPGILVKNEWFNWDFFFEVNVLEPACEYCGSFEDVTNEFKHFKLCGECNETYDDKTGYCSLYCCIENRCDDSC